MNYEDLTPDMKDKIRACKTPEELLELAKESGYELSDNELEQVSGGWGADVSSEYHGCSCEECHSFYCGIVECNLTCSSYSYDRKV